MPTGFDKIDSGLYLYIYRFNSSIRSWSRVLKSNELLALLGNINMTYFFILQHKSSQVINHKAVRDRFILPIY